MPSRLMEDPKLECCRKVMNTSSNTCLSISPSRGEVEVSSPASAKHALPVDKSDMNENMPSKRPRIEAVPTSSGSENSAPAVSPNTNTGLVPTVPQPSVSTPPAIVSFPAGINLTISNGIINMKNSIAVDGGPAILVTPGASPSISSLAAVPCTLVKGTVTTVSSPMTTGSLTTLSTSMVSATQAGTSHPSSHTQLKVPNPGIQIRPQGFASLQGNSLAMAMQTRLSLPFQTTVGQGLTVPTTLGTLSSLQPSTSSLLSPQMQFQTMPLMRSGAVSLSGTNQPQPSNQQGTQQVQQQPMSIRPFPLLLNRPLSFSGRSQLFTTPQQTRLAPRPVGPQAVQVAGQQPASSATLVPLFRPSQSPKVLGSPSQSFMSAPSVNIQGQTPQFVNQVVAVSATSPAGMTHITFQPSVSGTKVLERPGKVAEGRLIPTTTSARLVRPIGVGGTSVASSGAMVDTLSSLGKQHEIVSSPNSLMRSSGAVTLSGTGAAATKHLQDSTTNTFPLVGEPPVKMSFVVQPPAGGLKDDSATSLSTTAPLSQENKTTGHPENRESNSGEKKIEQLDEKDRKSEDASDGANIYGDFDAAKAMEWNDGIGTLPGSNLKFKLDEFGFVDLVMDEAPETVNMMVDSSVGVNTAAFNPPDSSAVRVADSPSSLIKRENDPIQKCENCGKYGYLSDFCKSGRFCSQTCVGAYAGKKNLHRKHNLLSAKMVINLKKKKKKLRALAVGAGSGDAVSLPTQSAVEDGEEEKVVQPTGRKPRGFSWQDYLEEQKVLAAPPRFFRDPFPAQRNGFKAGMRLEGIDPKHQNLFCVLSVAETQGYRLRLHFDGYSECYDFWTCADSPYIFPVGWCEKNNKPLQPPKHVPPEAFNWASYLRTTKSIAAPRTVFVNQPAASVTPSAFRVGMKLEAVDRKNTALICVATVADTLGDKVLVHFDGWEDVYDYWCDITSPYIHPVGWCQENARTLSPPCDWKEVETFTWEEYLLLTKSSAVPARAFKPRTPVGFEPGMKVEAVDRRNPILVRVATIKEVKEHQVLLHFDGWPEMYDYWMDDDCPDIRPPHWCARTGHPLQPPFNEDDHTPGSCPTPCCIGVGHIKGAKYVGHHSAFGCPYSPLNMNKESTLQDRLGSTRAEEGSAAPSALRIKTEYGGEVRKCPTPGCDSSGHITGRFTSHHRLSGCPLYEKNILRMKAELAGRPVGRPGRGRKKKSLDGGEHVLCGQNDDQYQRDYDPSAVLHEGIHQSVFMSAIPPTPSQENPPFWEHHVKLLPGVSQITGTDVKRWSITEVATFVSSLPGCWEQEKVFREQQIDGEAFLLLNQADIVKIMNIKLGPALKIFNSILIFKQTLDS